MFTRNTRGINAVVIVFFVLIVLVASAIVVFSLNSAKVRQAPSAPVESSVSEEFPLPDSNAIVELKKQCTESCDDNDPCTRDFCNTVYGQCDHEIIIGCCGNNACDGSETCVSSEPGADNSNACAADCGACIVSVNIPPMGWCTLNELDSSLLPPYAATKASLSGSKASLSVEVMNPSEFTATNIKVELYTSAGFDLESGQSKSVSIEDIAKYDAKSVSFSFAKQSNAVVGDSNPTFVKLTYSLNNKNAVLCTQVVFS